MALGLTIGGCSCICAATLWKIDPATGEIVWSVNRGDGSTGLDVVVGSPTMVFECGRDNDHHQIVTRWNDNGNSPEHVWDSDCNVPTDVRGEDVAYSDDDGKLWAIRFSTPGNLLRLDPADGSFVNSIVTISQSGELIDGPSDAMNVWLPNSIGSRGELRQYGPAGILATATPTSIDSIAAIGADAKANGFCSYTSVSPGGLGSFRKWDANLAGTGSLNNPSGFNTTKVLRNAASASKGLYNSTFFGHTGLALVGLAAFTFDWTVTSGHTNTNGAVDPTTNDVYAIGLTNAITAVAALQKRSAATGALQWSVVFTQAVANVQFPIIEILQDTTRVYVVGHFLHSGDVVDVLAVNKADGSVAWRLTLETNALFVNALSIITLQDAQLRGGYLYVCGAIGSLAAT